MPSTHFIAYFTSGGGGGSGVWILITGFWGDTGSWIDTDSWID